jgi:hypothetical protein
MLNTALLRELSRLKAEYGAEAVSQHLLSDFSTTLEAAVEQGLFANQQPTWANPTTGKVATSVAVAFDALGLWVSRWSKVRKVASTLPSFHVRYGVKRPRFQKGRDYASRFGTICLDLEDMETLILAAAPRKGKAALRAFKAEHGLAS